jgi:hypothetical protein
MHAREPDLLNAPGAKSAALVPQDRMKAAAFVVERQGMISAFHVTMGLRRRSGNVARGIRVCSSSMGRP